MAAATAENDVRTSSATIDLASIPELDNIIYATKVLSLVEKTEAQWDDELDAKAAQYGISISRLPTPDKQYISSAESASTAITSHARTFSAGSNTSADTAMTDISTLFPSSTQDPKSTEAAPRKPKPKVLSFSQYERYLKQLGPNLDQPKNCSPTTSSSSSSQSLFSSRSSNLSGRKTGRSLIKITSGLKTRLGWQRSPPPELNRSVSCICCRETFESSTQLQTLLCSHSYCGACLKVMVEQATTDETKMPPRCCTQPVPSSVLRSIMSKESQQAFLKAVVLFSTPWEARIFCPNAGCGEFVPPRSKVDPKHPFTVTCRKCQTRVCSMCKREAHPVGKDCPEDHELEQVLKMGEKSGWRRCYKCRSLVELANGCTHMTCRCRAQFCYICGGVWDSTLGCPNVCSGEEELERRRVVEEERQAELDAQRSAREAEEALEASAKAEAERRSREHEAFKALQIQQSDEQARYDEFETKCRQQCLDRQSALKKSLLEKQQDQEEKMKDRHHKTATHLEDRQISAEMELRATHEASERSVRIRLKHMEAYCNPATFTERTLEMPARIVTERDHQELQQQYTLRDGIERLHQSKINVMRDRQAKRMEELLERHEAELVKLQETKSEELEDLAAQFALEHDTMNSVLKERKAKLRRRWELAMELLCKEMGAKDGLRYESLPRPSWPDDSVAVEDHQEMATREKPIPEPTGS